MNDRTQSSDRETGLGSTGADGTGPASADDRSRPGTLAPRAYLLFGVATLLGLAHHLDHVIRGNHVGWPITPDVNPFTYSLGIYPLVALGFALSLTGRAGARYWTVVMALGTAMLAFFHLSPWAVEPPSDVVLPYADPAFGYLAFAILLALIGVVGAGALYSARQWVREWS
jgi:hypothetical protein